MRQVRRFCALSVASSVLAVFGMMQPAFAFAPAAHRNPPQIPARAYQAKPLRVITFVPADGSATDPTNPVNRLMRFGEALVNSTWYSSMSGEYGLGTGTSAGFRASAMPFPGNNPSLADVRAFVRQAAGVHGVGKGSSSVKTMWNLFFRCVGPGSVGGHDCGGGFHAVADLSGSTTDPLFEPDDAIAINIITEDQFLDPALSFATRVSSHEIIEGATDNGGTGYRLATNFPNKPWVDASPWVEVQNSGSTEVGDQGRLFGQEIVIPFVDAAHPARNFDYHYQRIFANSAAAAGGDPALPASPVPYYSVTTASSWYSLSLAHSIANAITVKGWSVQAEPDWTMAANVLAWSGGPDGPKRCGGIWSKGSSSYPLDAGPTLNNNQTATLILEPVGASAGDWCVVEITSHRTGMEPGGSGHVDPNGDFYHSWIIGVHYTA